MASALRAQGLPIGPVVTMERRDRDGAREALRAVREADKVKGQRSFEAGQAEHQGRKLFIDMLQIFALCKTM